MVRLIMKSDFIYVCNIFTFLYSWNKERSGAAAVWLQGWLNGALINRLAVAVWQVFASNGLKPPSSSLSPLLQMLPDLKADNQRLKDENGALIRVISKLSK